LGQGIIDAAISVQVISAHGYFGVVCLDIGNSIFLSITIIKEILKTLGKARGYK